MNKNTAARFVFTVLFLAVFACLLAQPAGYYSSAENRSGENLKQTLHDIIDHHTVLTYTYLWTAFQSTDKKEDGTVWDMYSDRSDGPPPYTYLFGSDQCGNYSGEGSCYNREHSFPKSWFGDQSPMNTDLLHIYPTDGYVNGKRGNYPFGETGTANWTSQNGSKLGPSSVDGFTGTVFEPVDEYKGDFARTYFYMATRYYGEDSNWPGSPMSDGSQLKPWAEKLLISWHRNDPVSEKEQLRNDAVFELQGNRNPYIDHPEFVDLVFVQDYSDTIPPVLDSVSVLSSTLLQLWFNEKLDSLTALDDDLFSISENVTISKISLADTSYSSLLLEVSGLEDASYVLSLYGITDYSGNVMELVNYEFSVALVNQLILKKYRRMSVYPNPANRKFRIVLDEHATTVDRIEMIDVYGRIFASWTMSFDAKTELETDAPAAYYFLQVIYVDGFRFSLPLVIQ